MKEITRSGKTALVVGASRGIGRAIALRLARLGFDLWLSYRSSAKEAEALKAEAEAIGAQCELLCFDASDYAQTQEVLGARVEQGAPFAVVYNAGVTRDNLMMWMSKEEWDTVLSTNLDGFYNVTRAVLFAMLKAGGGRIVAVSSVSGQIGQAGQVNYSASKAGLIGAVKALAREVGKRNVIVNVVAPGFIETGMTEAIPKEKVLPLIPLNRIGGAEDVASVVGFLCAEENMYIHGQVIGINGGLAM